VVVFVEYSVIYIAHGLVVRLGLTSPAYGSVVPTGLG
jgi:hypothetical protein